ncbi:MAG: metal ABC transporter substrate-binding protein [bacterium]|nr:metal ABC transporter substrate-binding protein [bacterium]
MRKVRLLMTVLLLCIVAAGCQKQNTIQDDPDKINVTATIFPQYDFTREIAGDQVDLRLLLPPGGESHSYEPTPQDIIAIQNSDVFIYVGGESDAWIDDILASMDTSHMQLISLMDCVDAVEEEVVEGMQSEEHHEDEAHAEETEYDEHVWTSPVNAILITEKITEALQAADTKNAEFYQKNCDSYIAKLDTLDQEFRDLVSGAAHKVLVFGDRFPFRYFTEEYGLEYYAAFPGCSAETEPSAATISFLINQVKTEQIPVVFHIEFSNEKVADAICESTGAKKLLFHSCHNVDQADMDAGVSYLSIMQGNLKNLKEALQ